MYFFVFDAQTAKRRYERRASQIVLRINDLELPHDKALTSSLNTVDALVEDALEKDVFDTIIAVGDDTTARATINAILRRKAQNSKQDVAFGFVPITKTVIGEMFGIPIGAKAIPLISKRRVEEVDVGKLNKSYFIGSVIIRAASRFDDVQKISHKLLHGRQNKPIHAHIEVNGLKLDTDVAYIAVSNMLLEEEQQRLRKLFSIQLPTSNPQSGKLQLAILGTKKNDTDLTIFHASEFLIETEENVVASVDNVQLRQHNFQFRVNSDMLTIIVGAEREF